jgi:hypothetical protein
MAIAVGEESGMKEEEIGSLSRGGNVPRSFCFDQVIAGWRRHVTEERSIDKIRAGDVIGRTGGTPTHSELIVRFMRSTCLHVCRHVLQCKQRMRFNCGFISIRKVNNELRVHTSKFICMYT